jgi:hypothetical protein
MTSLIWKLLPQILAILVVAVVAVLDYVWHDKRTKKFRATRFWLFLLIVPLMLLSVLALLKEERANLQEKEAFRTQLASISKSLEAAKPYFDLYINGSGDPLPDFSTIHMPQSRKIDVSVANSGPGAASHVVVECVLPLSTTNLDYPFWTVFGHPTRKDTMKEDSRVTVLGTGRDTLASGSAIQASISISTNVGFPTFSRRELEGLRFLLVGTGTNLPMDAPVQMLPAVFNVHADATSTRKFVVLFLP